MKARVALITGGYSGEAVISYQSADTVKNALQNSEYELLWVDILEKGWTVTSNGRFFSIDKTDFSFIESGIKKTFDCALVCIHGTPGEDGVLQEYFNSIKLPYTSGRAENMTLTFDKKKTTSKLAALGYSVAKSVLLDKTNWNIEQAENLTLPLFVKPNSGGSSLGMSKVESPDALLPAIEKAFAVGDEVLVEEELRGTDEVTCGVCYHKGEVVALPPTEIVTENAFFDYAAKYEKQSQEITPARVSDDLISLIKSTSIKIYKDLNCSGIVRVDYICTSDSISVIEVNSIPGLSSESLIPKQLIVANISITEVLEEMIEKNLK